MNTWHDNLILLIFQLERMVNLDKLIQKSDKEIAKIEVSGAKLLKGSIIDLSNDIVVLFNGKDYLYIPFDHIKDLTVSKNDEDEISQPSEPSNIIITQPSEKLTLKNVLAQAQGMYIEIYVTGKAYLQGYISKILDDYIVFHSPIYKTMYISLKHLKWLIPYSTNQRPYGLTEQSFTIQPRKGHLPQTFNDLVNKMKDELIVINLGEKNHHSGKINSINGSIIEIHTSRTVPYYFNIDHIQTIHQV